MKPSTTSAALIGDIHGCSAELAELLARIGQRRVVSLGDVVDRGPDPDGCVRLLRERDADVVLGNHEDKHFRWRKHEAKARATPGYKNPMQLAPHHHETERLVSAESWRWLEERSVGHLRLEEHGVLAVHAGLQAGVAPEKHKLERICRVQFTKPGLGDKSSPWGGWRRGEGGVPELAGPQVARAIAEGYRWWTEFVEGGEGGEGGEVVVYGHSVFPVPFATYRRSRDATADVGADTRVEHVFLDGDVDGRARENQPIAREGLVALGIDTGAPFGGALTALLVPEWTLVRVEAKVSYFGGSMADD